MAPDSNGEIIRDASSSDPELGSRLCQPTGSHEVPPEDEEEFQDAQHQLSPRISSPRAFPSIMHNADIGTSLNAPADPSPSHRPTTGVSLRNLRATARSRVFGPNLPLP
jgi:hypothetical protein